jgi:rhodanese-related sulfurtransferase
LHPPNNVHQPWTLILKLSSVELRGYAQIPRLHARKSPHSGPQNDSARGWAAARSLLLALTAAPTASRTPTNMHLLVPLAMLLALGAVVGVRRGAGTALSRLCRPTLSAVDDDTMEALLITPSELARRLDEPGVVVIEVVSPADAAKDPLRIPGSQRVWRPNYELPVCEPDQPFVGLAPTPAAFTELAQGLGIDDDSEVVILSRKYDETRLWWLFVACGKRSVRLLDGGYSAWLAAECPTTADAPAPRPRGTWTANPLDARLLASMDDVAQLRDASAARLWDVRTAEEYAGSTTMPGAVWQSSQPTTPFPALATACAPASHGGRWWCVWRACGPMMGYRRGAAGAHPMGDTPNGLGRLPRVRRHVAGTARHPYYAQGAHSALAPAPFSAPVPTDGVARAVPCRCSRRGAASRCGAKRRRGARLLLPERRTHDAAHLWHAPRWMAAACPQELRRLVGRVERAVGGVAK